MLVISGATEEPIMEEPEEEVRFYEQEKIKTIGLEETAARREIQKAFHESTGGRKVEIGIERPPILPRIKKPQQCPIVISYYRLTLKGRKSQKKSTKDTK